MEKVDLSILSGKVVAVTGGGGYVGLRLIQELLKLDVQSVLLLDFRIGDIKSKIPSSLLRAFKNKVKLILTDIRDYEKVKESVKSADIVFHLASYGMSGAEMLQKKLINDVNVNGTENIIKACIENNINSLVYTSTYNVVFGGQVCDNLDESLDYFPIEKHPDEYSRTKALAEIKIRKANGVSLKRDGKLATCAVRPAAIYGEGEERHFPRIVRYAEQGLLCFTIGNATVDWVHVDNLVYAHLLAGSKLLRDNIQSVVAGKAYFISDQFPVNNFEFMRPLLEAIDIPYPKINLPTWFVYYVGFLLEIIHRIVSPVYHFQPLLSRAEVFKVGVTHYFSPKKSQTELEYFPIISEAEGVKRLADYWREKTKESRKARKSNIWIYITLAIALLSFLYWKLFV